MLTLSYLVRTAAVVSCCCCTAAVAGVVVAGCCELVADRNRPPSRDEAGNDAVDADGVVGAADVVAVADDGGEGGGAVAAAAGGADGWPPRPNSDNQLLRHRMPRRHQKASQPPLGVVAGADGVAAPRRTNRCPEPFPPFRSASGRPTSCTLLHQFRREKERLFLIYVF